MKKTLIIIGFLLISVAAQAESIRERLQRARSQEGQQQAQPPGESAKIKNGVVTENYSNGSPSMVATYKQGKMDGEAKVYFENGRLKEVANYKNDQLHGIRKKYNEKGKLILEENYVNGALDGARKEYDADGNPMMEETYRNGEREGTQTLYHPNGKIRSRAEFVNGAREGSIIENYPSGQLKVETFFKEGLKQWEKKYLYSETKGSLPHTQLIYVQEHTFGPSGQLIKTRHYDASGKVIFSQEAPKK